MLKSSGLEDNVNIKLRAGKNDDEHISMNELRTPKMSNNWYPHLSTVTSNMHCLQKMNVFEKQNTDREITQGIIVQLKIILVYYHIQTTNYLNQNAMHLHILLKKRITIGILLIRPVLLWQVLLEWIHCLK